MKNSLCFLNNGQFVLFKNFYKKKTFEDLLQSLEFTEKGREMFSLRKCEKRETGRAKQTKIRKLHTLEMANLNETIEKAILRVIDCDKKRVNRIGHLIERNNELRDVFEKIEMENIDE